MIRYLPGRSNREGDSENFIISTDHRSDSEITGWRNYGAESLYIGERRASVEWSLFRGNKTAGAELKIGTRYSENQQMLTLRLGPIGNVYICHGRGFLPKSLTLRGRESRVFGFRVTPAEASYQFGAPRNSHSKAEPGWMRGRWRFRA